MAKSRLTPDYIEWVLKLNADQAAKEMHKINQANRELAKQQDAARQAMAKLEAEGKKGSQEWKNLKKSVKEYGNEIKTNNEKLKELDKRLDLNQRSAAELSKRLRTLRKELQNTSKATDPQRYKELQRQIKQTEAAYRSASGAAKGFMGSLLSLASIKRTMAGFFMGMGSMIAMSVISGFKKAIDTIVEFEKANSRLAGVLGTTKAGIKDLTDEARRLGATTSYTASEVTQLQTELAKLGFDKNQIKAMEEPILKFAVAVDTDLASAATVAGGALRVFGKDAADSESVLATLAVATTKSALSFEHYSTMLSTAAPVAHAFNFSLEDTTALMGALRNANFDASSAATATRNILLNLANGSGKLAKALGGPVKDLDGLVAGLKKLKNEGIDLFTSAADAICVDGHVVNKVGTYQIAIAAKYHGIPYFVSGKPEIDHPTIQSVNIEMRDPDFVLQAMGVRTAAEGVKGYYPSFDITPPHLVSGVATDRGIFSPYDLARYFDGMSMAEMKELMV